MVNNLRDNADNGHDFHHLADHVSQSDEISPAVKFMSLQSLTNLVVCLITAQTNFVRQTFVGVRVSVFSCIRVRVSLDPGIRVSGCPFVCVRVSFCVCPCVLFSV